jgi:hypothetical protein
MNEPKKKAPEDRPFADDFKDFLNKLDWKSLLLHLAFYALIAAGVLLMYTSVLQATQSRLIAVLSVVFSEGFLIAWKEGEERAGNSDRQISVSAWMKWIHVVISGVFITLNFSKEMLITLSGEVSVRDINVAIAVLFGAIAIVNLVAFLVWRSNDRTLRLHRETDRIIADASHAERRAIAEKKALEKQRDVIKLREENDKVERGLRASPFYDFGDQESKPRPPARQQQFAPALDVRSAGDLQERAGKELANDAGEGKKNDAPLSRQ